MGKTFVTFRLLKMFGIDAIDDLHVAGQHAFQQGNRPALECLGQQRVVGVGKRCRGYAPRIAPRHAVDVKQDAHELGDGQTGMRIVDLDGSVLRQKVQMAVDLEMPLHQVLQRS